MKTVTVNTSKKYEILITAGLLNEIGPRLRNQFPASKVAVISDENVWSIYQDIVCNSLHSAGYDPSVFVFPAGEHSKNGQTYLQILNFLAESKLSRSDVLIAFGGGVVGDITGFSAATYLRGIHYIQVPTSLLAMVDSSVGGKTAIDLDAGKNLAGAFYQPEFVLCDTDVLNTLPYEVFCDGCAEIIKYGVLYDEALFNHLAVNTLNFDREYVISRCVELKSIVVSHDEFDAGERQKLNLGHTVGHSIEKYTNFSVTHGQAVATGMAIVTRSCASFEYCDQTTSQRICNILQNFNLATTTNIAGEQLFNGILSDKKRSGKYINLIIPQKIGHCEILKMPMDDVKAFIEKGL